jgi:UDP-N-acetylglucosamine--N-acetylmuramyl-(pentapeptide) pyrophosphoryl-undecaprenol N-acetylglucosamine transferase
VLLTGNPLRRQILEIPGNKEQETKGTGEDFFNDLLFHLFIFGGSQGAHAINMAMIKAAPFLSSFRDRLSITHQTGEKDFKEVEAAYLEHGIKAEVSRFIADMAVQYRKADLIICRAGATTIAEVTACGKAALFIPFPHAVDDHQRRNAEALLKKDACFMLLERELGGENLAEIIRELMQDPEKINLTGDNAATLARLDAAKIIVDRIIEAKGIIK